MRRLRRSDLPADTVALARFLIGSLLVRDEAEGPCIVRIVETEAYVPGDAASHAFRRRTARNAAMFLRRGHAYVYFIYGSAFCLNVSSEAPGVGAAVLLRAGEPLAGLDRMRQRRGGATLRDVARGPGRLAAALDVDRRFDGVDLCVRGPLWLAAPAPDPTHQVEAVGESVRIGLTRETERVLRFFARGSPFLSGPRRLNA